MMRLTICLILACSPAIGQDFPVAPPLSTPRVDMGDTVEIEAYGVAEALVIYYNSAKQSSMSGTFTRSINGITVDVTIKVNDGGDGVSELAIVEPRGDYISIPDRLSVLDGEVGEFRILLPMY